MRNAGTGVRLAAAAFTLATALGGCGADAAPSGPDTSAEPSAEPSVVLPPATRLAGAAARAADRYYTASYRYVAPGGTGGTARVERTTAGVRFEIVRPADGTGIARTTVTVRGGGKAWVCLSTGSGQGCVDAGSTAGRAADPRLQLVYDAWLEVLASPTAALSVAAARAPGGAPGACWSVEGVTASLDPPVDAGVYCFDDSGVLTGVRLATGTLALTGTGPPPAQIVLPSPLTPSLPSSAAPSPPASTSPEPTPSATR